MLTAIKQRLDRDEEGFTLIELMVVVLIIAILLAIAIPTFLGARNTANARSTQSNLRNALTAEQTTWTNTQSFTADATSIEPALKWETQATDLSQGAKDVLATPLNSGSAVMLVGLAKDKNCYYVYQSNDATTSFTAYAAEKVGDTGCSVPAAGPTTAPTAAGQGAVQASGALSWFSSW